MVITHGFVYDDMRSIRWGIATLYRSQPIKSMNIVALRMAVELLRQAISPVVMESRVKRINGVMGLRVAIIKATPESGGVDNGGQIKKRLKDHGKAVLDVSE